MEENTQTEEVKGKLSYEQLESLAGQMSQELREAKYKIGMIQNGMAIERMKFLFEVVKAEVSFSPEFVSECINEIQDSLKIIEEEDTSDTEIK